MFPYQQIPTTSLFYQALLKTIVNFVVKTRNDMPVAPAVRTVFRETAPDYALDNFQTMQQAVDQSNFSQRLGLYLTGAFAGMAVLMVVEFGWRWAQRHRAFCGWCCGKGWCSWERG